MQRSHVFGDRAFWRAMLALALPIALQNLLVSSFSLVDTCMIGTLGESTIAAVGMAGQFSWLLNLVLFGFSSGAAVFIAQYWGMKDEAGIRRAYGLALSCATGASVLFTLVGLFAAEPLLRLFTQDEIVIEYGAAYLRIACLSYPAIAINNISCTVLRSTEKVKLPLYVSMASVACNAIFNALLIYGLRMGVRGAALATVISAWIGPFVTYLISYRQKNILVAKPSELFRFEKAFVGHYIRVSLPVLLNESMWGLGTVLFKMIYANRSTQFYAALTVFSSIEGMLFSFMMGLCHASAVMVGKSVGAGDLRQAKADAERHTRLMIVISAALGLLIIALRDVVLLPFSVSETAANYARAIMLVYGLEIWLRNIPYITIVGVFRAGGDTRTGVRYDILGLWCIALPLTFLCANVFKLDLMVVYAVMLLSEDSLKSFLCIRRLRSGLWFMPVTRS